MYKIAMIGDRDSVLGFMALGFAVFEAEAPDVAGAILSRLARSGEYAVIFLTEALARELDEVISHYKDQPLPAITVIPSRAGSEGYGMGQIRRAVERAVGADILFKEQ